MFAWINLGLMIIFAVCFVALYIRSVSPAVLEPKMGLKAYPYCGRLRALSIFFLVLVMVNYLAYDFYPLSIPDLMKFPWPYPVSVILGVLIAIPTSYMVITGLKDAGDEAVQPDKESEMFGGIYSKIRHPQTWEYAYFFTIGFLLNRPFLVLISFLWIPSMVLMMSAEEKDLLIRYGDEYREYMETTGRLLPRKQAKP